MTVMTHVEKICRTFNRNPGQFLTLAMITKETHIPKHSVRSRISDMRTSGISILTEYQWIGGKKKAYYRLG